MQQHFVTSTKILRYPEFLLYMVEFSFLQKYFSLHLKGKKNLFRFLAQRFQNEMNSFFSNLNRLLGKINKTSAFLKN